MDYILFDKINKTIKFVPYDQVFDELYYGKCSVPLKEHVDNYIKKGKDKKILSYFTAFTNQPDLIIQNIKNDISKINNKVPLYDEYTKNLHIVPKENVYKAVVYNSYRFPNKELQKILKERRDELRSVLKQSKKAESDDNLSNFDKSPLIHYDILHTTQLREYHKLILMLNFLKQFNIDILETTYVTVFYFYANEVGKDITVCKKPSFLPYFRHIDPYYRRGELINLALNMKLIKPDDKYYDQEEIMKLCYLIKENDISADILLKHQEHMIKNDKIGIIRYYSLHGSFFINKYLRDNSTSQYQNKILENITKSMYDLVTEAPAFDKSYILYRFISNDSYLKYLKVGDTHIEGSFISTTRDPFYKSEIYRFGFILIKIKIPANVKGVGLCIETFSDFPAEQEIILPPFTKLLLDKKDDNEIYYHYDSEQSSKISTKYEFTYVGYDKLTFIERVPVQNTLVDFFKISQELTLTIHEKIKIFINNYANEIYHFDTMIGSNVYTLIAEWYDSTSVYKKYYAATSSDGFSIYLIHNNYLLFFIELSEENDYTSMYVNYYFKRAEIGKKVISDNEFIEFLAKMAYYFGIRNVILFASYESCDNNKKRENEINKVDDEEIYIYRGGTYCVDYYRYLKYKEKRFNNKNIQIDSTELKPKFSYYQLDRLKTVDPLTVLSRENQDEIYQIYTKTFKILVDSTKHNLADFYLWTIENQCVHLPFLIKYINKIYDHNSPFYDNDYYVLDSSAFLYNRGLISVYSDMKLSKDKYENNRVPNKNDYRLRTFEKEDVPT